MSPDDLTDAGQDRVVPRHVEQGADMPLHGPSGMTLIRMPKRGHAVLLWRQSQEQPLAVAMERPGRDYSLGCLPIVVLSLVGLLVGIVVGWNVGGRPGTDLGGAGQWPHGGVVRAWALIGLLAGMGLGFVIAWFGSPPPKSGRRPRP